MPDLQNLASSLDKATGSQYGFADALKNASPAGMAGPWGGVLSAFASAAGIKQDGTPPDVFIKNNVPDPINAWLYDQGLTGPTGRLQLGGFDGSPTWENLQSSVPLRNAVRFWLLVNSNQASVRDDFEGLQYPWPGDVASGPIQDFASRAAGSYPDKQRDIFRMFSDDIKLVASQGLNATRMSSGPVKSGLPVMKMGGAALIGFALGGPPGAAIGALVGWLFG